MSTVVENSVKYVVVTPTSRTEMERRWSFNSRQMYNFRNKEFSTLKGAQKSLQQVVEVLEKTINKVNTNLSKEEIQEFKNELEVVKSFKLGKAVVTKTVELV